MGRPRLYETIQEKWRTNKRRQRRKAVAPNVLCREIGPHCTVYQGSCEAIYRLLPCEAAVVSDPPYPNNYDYPKPRRRDSHWKSNFPGMDQPFNPMLWLQFPEVILMGAACYDDRLPAGGSRWIWDKTEGRNPGDYARYEEIWLWKSGPWRYYPYLWRGGMRRGEENITRLRDKLHQAQKPIELLTDLVLETTAPVVIDPFMGSCTTLAGCISLGRPCIGIELEPDAFAVACQRLQEEVAAARQATRQGTLFPCAPRVPWSTTRPRISPADAPRGC